MSIYSGFATRSQENYYDKILYNIMSTLVLRLIKLYQHQTVNEDKFFSIIKKQQKCLKKMEKRKYLQPKYSHLLESLFLSYQQPEQCAESISDNVEKQVKEMHRTLSLLDQQMHQLKQGVQLTIQNSQPKQQQLFAHKKSLTKIEQVIPRPQRRHKSKSKKFSVKKNLDLWDIRHSKSPQLPSLHPVEHTLLTKTNFNSICDLSERQNSKFLTGQDSQKQFSVNRKTKYKNMNNFRTNMFFKK